MPNRTSHTTERTGRYSAVSNHFSTSSGMKYIPRSFRTLLDNPYRVCCSLPGYLRFPTCSFPGSFPLFSDLRTYPTFLRFWTLGLIRPFLPKPSSEHSLGVLWPLLTSVTASDQLPLFVVPKNTVTDLPRYDALLSHFTCQIYLATMFRLSIGFEYRSPLPRSPSLISASCSSGQWFAIDFLQTPRYRDALAELLALPLQRVSR